MRKNWHWVAIALVFAFVVFALFGTLKAKELRAIVLICSKGEMVVCSVHTARVSFVVPVQSPLPAECLTMGMKKMAEVSGLYDHDRESVKVECPR